MSFKMWELDLLQNRSLDEKINEAKKLISKYKDKKSCIAFSGGRNSTIILHLAKDILKNFTVLFVNTSPHFYS